MVTRTVRTAGHGRRRLDPGGDRRRCGRTCPRSPTARWRPSSTRCPAIGRAERQHGRDHPQRGAAGARRLPLPGRRPARGRRPGRRPPRRSRAPTSSAAARLAAAAPPTRCSSAYRIGARVVVARHVRRAPWRPGSTPSSSRRSPSWCSPTSTSCRRPASPGTPTSWRAAGGCASGNLERARPPTCSTASPTDAVQRRRRARRLGAAGHADGAVIVPEAQARARARALAGSDAPADRRRAGLPEGHARCWCPTPHGRRARRAAPRAARHRRGRRPGASLAGGAGVVRPGAARARRSASRAGDTEEHLAWLVLAADAEALADLRARVLAPLADLRPVDRREAHRHPALLAAAPRPPRGGRRGAVRPPPDRALPHGPAARDLRRPASRTPTPCWS